MIRRRATAQGGAAVASATGTARESWSSRRGFVLAAVGSAVGLGSIWKFPYEVGSNGGIGGGIEAACKVLMPLLVLLLTALAIYAASGGGFQETLRFLFRLDLARVDARSALQALGLGFFSIGVGIALMVTYAAYADGSIDLRRAAIATVVADTAISFLAGFAVFPLVFARGLDPAGGPGLVFVTLPLAFARMPLGTLAAVAFFLLLFMAALASAISLLELVAAMFIRQRGWPRPVAAAVPAAVCFAAGLVTVLSFNRWAQWYPLAFLPGLARATPFDLIDRLTSELLLPAGGLALGILGGWVLPPALFERELGLSPRGACALRRLLRWAVPAAILAAVCAPLVL